VSKKAGFIVVKNDKRELVQTRLPTKIRVYIDYHKLNSATCKDHFPLSFIDQMLNKLVGHEYCCSLDGYSGYNQIPIALEDPKKNHVHLLVWDICIPQNAIWVVQRPSNFSTLHA